MNTNRLNLTHSMHFHKPLISPKMHKSYMASPQKSTRKSKFLGSQEGKGLFRHTSVDQYSGNDQVINGLDRQKKRYV